MTISIFKRPFSTIVHAFTINCNTAPKECGCSSNITNIAAKNLLSAFEENPSKKPITFVNILKDFGGKKKVDALLSDLNVEDLEQVKHCVKNWKNSESLKVPGDVLSLAIANSKNTSSLSSPWSVKEPIPLDFKNENKW